MEEKYTDEYYMSEALSEARLALEEDEVPIGAVVVCGNRIIARAHNRTESLHDPTAHAEMLAITAATSAMGAKYLKECRLYVTVEPCIMCAGAISWAQLGELIYATEDEKKGFQRVALNNVLTCTVRNLNSRKDEAATLMKAFFSNKR
jgi:tRNA(adenine34) deaminase